MKKHYKINLIQIYYYQPSFSNAGKKTGLIMKFTPGLVILTRNKFVIMARERPLNEL